MKKWIFITAIAVIAAAAASFWDNGNEAKATPSKAYITFDGTSAQFAADIPDCH